MVNICFSIQDADTLRGGVERAGFDMDGIARETESRVFQECFKADKILNHVDGVLNMMDEDRKAAVWTREHNKEVLYRLEQRLNELQQQAQRLREEYSRAYENYRRAMEEETRVHNSSQKAEGALSAAQSNVRQADRRCAEIKRMQRQNDEEIRKVRILIEEVKRIIEQLTAIIQRLEEAIREVAAYRDRLINDKQQLEWERPRFSSAHHDASMRLSGCEQAASSAMDYGEKICQHLDPDNDIFNHSTCQIVFTELDALERISRDLNRVCNDYEAAEEEIYERSAAHGETMQSNVIADARGIVDEVCDKCQRQIRKMRKTSKGCKKADVSLRAYYELADKVRYY